MTEEEYLAFIEEMLVLFPQKEVREPIVMVDARL